MQYLFDTGFLFGTPTLGGTSNVTPVMFGGLQEVTVNLIQTRIVPTKSQFQVEFKELIGNTRISGVAKVARINGALFSELFTNQNTVPGSILAAVDSPQTIVATSQIFFSTPMVADLGIKRAADSTPLTFTTGVPGPGQYGVNVSTRTYSFNAADVGTAILLSYTYSSASGFKIAFADLLKGEAPYFSLFLMNTYGGKQFTMTLNKVVTTKVVLPFRLETFSISEFSFEAISDLSQAVGTLSLSE